MEKTLKLLSTLDFPLRWVDMDSYRHVSQTRYFDAMTEARSQPLVIFLSHLNILALCVSSNMCARLGGIVLLWNITFMRWMMTAVMPKEWYV